MCYGHVDLKFVEREIQDRVQAAQVATASETDDRDVSVPPGLIGGLPGVWARLRHRLKGMARPA